MEAWLRGNLNPLLDGQIAQPVEHSPEKAGVVGSIPTLTTLRKPRYLFKKRAWAFLIIIPIKIVSLPSSRLLCPYCALLLLRACLSKTMRQGVFIIK
jgi:hypothetical protein